MNRFDWLMSSSLRFLFFDFALIGNPYLIQSLWILSFLDRQFNIDGYIPQGNLEYLIQSFDVSFLQCNLEYLNS